jgi:hypothetical protein
MTNIETKIHIPNDLRLTESRMNPFGRPKPKGKVPEEAGILMRAVFTLDALRIGQFAPELRNLRRELTDSHVLTGEGMSWSSLRRDINDLINFPGKSEEIGKRVSRLPILTMLLFIGFGVTGVAAVVNIYVLRWAYPLSEVVIPGLIYMSAISTLRWHYEESIRSYYETSKPKAEKIKRINNQLIGRLITVLQKAKYPLNDCYFALYNADYQNIHIKSKPKLYRGWYEVYPNPSVKQT